MIMAKNWTMAEAVVAIANNDGEAILDIGRRFPLLTNYVAKAVAGDGKAVVALFESIPEYLTANKVQTALKNALGEVSEVEDEEVEETAEEKPAKPAKKVEKKAAPKKVEAEEDDEDEVDEAADDYDAINGSKLYEMCKERGILSKCKTKKKADLIAALREDDANGGSDSDDEVEEAEETETSEYDGMSAQELFKECKKRGIKAELKKPAKYYIELLVADDNRDEADEEDDWEDEEEEEAPAPKKPAKKAEKPVAKKEEKKPAKKAAKVEEDEDDDWDI